jgi:hypothetical protein
MKKIAIILALLTIPVFGAQIKPQTSAGLRAKLNATFVPKFGPMNDYTIEEVLEVLYNISKDGKGQGINFIFNRNLNKPKAATAPLEIGQVLQINPITGLPVNHTQPGLSLPPNIGLPFPQFEAQGEKQIKIRGLSVPLHNLTLKQVLDVCAMSFSQPMTYVVMDYGIMFMRKPEGQANQFFRTFTINPNRLNFRPLNPRRLTPFGGVTPMPEAGGQNPFGNQSQPNNNYPGAGGSLPQYPPTSDPPLPNR